MLPPIGTTAYTKVAMAQVSGVGACHTLSVSHFFYFGNTLFYITSLAVFLLGWAKARQTAVSQNLLTGRAGSSMLSSNEIFRVFKKCLD